MAKKEKMNKHELVRILAQKTGLTIKDIEEVILPSIKDVMKQLADEEREMVLNGICKAKPHYKKGKKGTLNGVDYDNSDEIKTSVVVTFKL